MIQPKFKFIKTYKMSVFEMLGGMDWTSVKSFLLSWKDGQEGYATFHKVQKPKSPQQLGYYYAVILPHAVESFRQNEDYSLVMRFGDRHLEVELNQDNMDNFLKMKYAELEGKYKSKSEMSMAECSAFEDWCIKWCAKWLNCQIPPADTNWRQTKEERM